MTCKNNVRYRDVGCTFIVAYHVYRILHTYCTEFWHSHSKWFSILTICCVQKEKALNKTVHVHVGLIFFLSTFLDALSVDVNLNDPRCGDGGRVCPNDPLLFTCNVTDSPANIITVKIENVLDIDLNKDNTIDGDLPDGFTVQSKNVQINAEFVNYTLVLSIVNASLLNGSLIICDSNIRNVDGMAGCPVAGKLVCVLEHWVFVQIIIVLLYSGVCGCGWVGCLSLAILTLDATKWYWSDTNSISANSIVMFVFS